ncbi:MAG: AMP-binding protein [Spirochaetes bacterium]|nr:AMP-binding protein [Spirochaetota bacterium]
MATYKYPWEKEYKLLGIPRTFQPYPDKPVFHILEEAARKFKKNGIIQYDYKMTYPEVKRNAEKLAAALLRMGLKKGDRVATILPTSIQFVIADYAISRAGLVHIPSSALEPFETLKHKFDEGTPRVLICLAHFGETALRLMKKSTIEHLIVTKLDDYATDVAELKGHEIVNDIPGALWLTDILEKETGDSLPEIRFDVERDIETLLFTGGTTGIPKGCMLTHRNIYANSIQNFYAVGPSARLMQGAIAVLLGLPFFHSYGHSIMHTMTLLGADQILIPEPRDTKSMIRMIRKYRPVIQFGVPAQFMSLAAEDVKDLNILGISGSAPLPQSTQQNFEQKASGGIMEGYGLSEMSPTTHLNITLMRRLFGGEKGLRFLVLLLAIPGIIPLVNFIMRLQGPRITGKITAALTGFLLRSTSKKEKRKNVERRGTIGIPFPDTEVKILDVDDGRTLSWEEVLAGKTGEMCLKGPQRMLGYWPNPGSGLDEEGYVRTSDVVKVDDRGYFYVVDRTKDMIIVGGYKVYSREVDEILHHHPDIAEAATVGVPDPEREGSERVVVFVKPKSGHKSKLTEESVIKYLADRVAKYAVPKAVGIVDDLPVTAVQKVDKKALREMAIALYSKAMARATKKSVKKKDRTVKAKKKKK